MSKRLRPTAHKDWIGHPMYASFLKLITDTPPAEMLNRLNVDNHIEAHEHAALINECERQGIPVEDVRHYWYKSENFSIFSKNDKQKTYAEIRDEIVAEMSQHAPVYPTVKRTKQKDGHLLVIDPADIHIGKIVSATETGEDYDSQIAVQRALQGVRGIINKVQAYNIEKIIFIAGNDVLHTDTPKGSTTKGTLVETSGLWYDNFTLARKLYVDILELLIPIADVHVMFCPSNHDFMSGCFLMDSVTSWFRNCGYVSFDGSMSHRKYYEYGNNCIGATHGDGAKTSDLPLLMAQEAGQSWLKKHRYIYTHHVHHKTAKDHGSVCVESLRSPSGTDGWHHRNGYQHAPKAIEAFIHNKDHGQIARITHIF